MPQKMLIPGLCDIRRPQAGFVDFDKANRIPEILFFGGEIYKRSPSLSASPGATVNYVPLSSPSRLSYYISYQPFSY